MLSGAWVGNDSAWLSENTGITLKRNRKACTPNWPQQTPGFSHASEMWQVLAPHWHNKIFAKIHLVLLVTTIFFFNFFSSSPILTALLVPGSTDSQNHKLTPDCLSPIKTQSPTNQPQITLRRRGGIALMSLPNSGCGDYFLPHDAFPWFQLDKLSSISYPTSANVQYHL